MTNHPNRSRHTPRRPNGYLDRLRRHGRVLLVDDERAIGNGVIVTLQQGWSFDPLQDNRVAGADTPREALDMVRHALVYAGPYTE